MAWLFRAVTDALAPRGFRLCLQSVGQAAISAFGPVRSSDRLAVGDQVLQTIERRGLRLAAFDAIAFFLSAQLILPGARHWQVGEFIFDSGMSRFFFHQQ